jgi:hypothetical protein
LDIGVFFRNIFLDWQACCAAAMNEGSSQVIAEEGGHFVHVTFTR